MFIKNMDAMDLQRRDFFKILGAAGLTLAIGSELKASTNGKKATEFHGVLFDPCTLR